MSRQCILSVTRKFAEKNYATEGYGRLVSTPVLYSGGVGFKSQPEDWLSCLGYQLGKKEITDDMFWIYSLPSPRDQSSIWSLSAQWYTFHKRLILPHHRNVKKLFKHITFFGLNHDYNLVGIYLRKLGTSTNCTSFFTTTENRQQWPCI
jgi:hypothetical protein